MSRADDHRTREFHEWELRGRGWKAFERPVGLEPPFRPFTGYTSPPLTRRDDGRRDTRLSSFFRRLQRPVAQPAGGTDGPAADPAPAWSQAEALVEAQLTLPLARPPSPSAVDAFLRHACRSGDPVALEVLGTAAESVPQFVFPPRASARVERSLAAWFPGVMALPAKEALASAWRDSGPAFAAVELGLGLEFMLPLGDPRSELLAGVVSALDTLSSGELGLLQVMFELAGSPWPGSILRSVADAEGAPRFENRPELATGAREKCASPLFAVVVRLATSAEDASRCWEIVADMAAGFSALSRPASNYLVPLRNDGYPMREHEEDILSRRCRRSGMLLSLEELARFIALPTASSSPRLRRETARTRPAPEATARHGSLLLGDNRHAGVAREVWLSPEDRVRHCHIVGASGTGKSTLLFNLIWQDIESGQGVAVLDPHGDLVDRVLGSIPPERIGDVVLVDPSDEGFSVGLNVLAAHSEFEKNLLASDLVGVFRRLSTSWGDQMNSVLRNAVLAFLESTEGGTLADLRLFLLDAGFRSRFLSTVTDPEVVFYWQKAFPQLAGGKSVGPVVTRLDEFLSRRPIRHMVSQKGNSVDFSKVIDGGRILLAKLPQGLIGRENSYLLGSLLLSKIQQAAMGRQRMAESERRDFWCYVDEFHSFITPSMAEILTGARKYRVGLTLAHQELRQMQTSDEVSGAVANAFTRVAFRVGDADARALESGFSHFEAKDLQNLEIGEAVCRVERSDSDFNLTVRRPLPAAAEEAARRGEVVAASRAAHARPRAEIEAEALGKLREEETAAAPKKRTPAGLSRSPDPSGPTPAEPAGELSPAGGQTGSGRTIYAVQRAAAIPVSQAPRDPPELGRGGAQHQAIQSMVKAAAEEAGFRVTVEKSVLDGQGSIDLVLERQGDAFACEINVTSTIDYEVGNVGKCLKAGFARIAVICPRPDRLIRLEEAVRGCLPAEQSAKVTFHSPDGFISFLKQPAIVASESQGMGTAAETRRRGYKVKRRFVEVSEEEAKARELAAIQAIAEKLRQNRGT